MAPPQHPATIHFAHALHFNDERLRMALFCSIPAHCLYDILGRVHAGEWHVEIPRAYERGVKLIGATAHYVTADLDEGPIIEQDVERVSHLDSVAELTRKGADVEKLVLSHAILRHIERKTIVFQNRVVVFS